MGNKIIVEFDRDKLKYHCKIIKMYPGNWCKQNCLQEDEDLIECALTGDIFCNKENGDFKIKEQMMETNENKMIRLEREKSEILESLRIYGSEIYCESIENKLKEIEKELEELYGNKTTED